MTVSDWCMTFHPDSLRLRSIYMMSNGFISVAREAWGWDLTVPEGAVLQTCYPEPMPYATSCVVGTQLDLSKHVKVKVRIMSESQDDETLVV